MARALNEDIFERGTSHRDAVDLAGKGLHHGGHQAMTFGTLQADGAAQHSGLYCKTGGHAFRQGARRLWVSGLEQHYVAADGRLQLRRGTQRDQVALVQNGQPVAVLGLFHQVSGHQDRDALLVAQSAQVLPHVAARARIETG